jgi:predicted RND superfamily exporter protein
MSLGRRLLDAVDRAIVERAGSVVVLFLLLTLVFASGLGNLSTEAGTEEFAEDVPSADALDAVNREFEPAFGPDDGSTQLIQRAENVLSGRELVRMLTAQERLAEDPDLRVAETSSVAALVAQTIDPEATTLERQRLVLERATPTEIERAVRELAADPAFTRQLSSDFNARSASASATVGVVTHDLPAELDDAAAGQGGESPLTPIQREATFAVASVGGDITVFGSGIIADEFGEVLADTILIVTPAAGVLIVLFLVVAYRDLLDLLIGVSALAMTVVWTFGFTGLVGIPFGTLTVAVPPLLLAVGIDFGIHAVNRYREDRQTGESVEGAMRLATDQLLVAFAIVTGTSVIGFLSNLASELPPIREFGLVASVGICFTFLIFGIFLPALKVWVDRRRERIPIPTISQRPLGGESTLGRTLDVGVGVAERAPVGFLLVVLVLTGGVTVYATGVDTSFSDEDFLPPEEVPPALAGLPEPFRPSDYRATATINFLEEAFETTEEGTVTVYWETRMERDTALEEMETASTDPPASFVTEDRLAVRTSVVTVIQEQAERDPEFRALVARNDADGNGIPDRNLDEVYDALLASPARASAEAALADDRRSARIVYVVEADATQAETTADAALVADRFRGTATATGTTVVFQEVADLIFASALTSLAISLFLTLLFLFAVYWLLERSPSLGLANALPIVVSVTLVAGTMRAVGVSFNAVTATILALTIGLGIDYSVHVVHRFVDERRTTDLATALDRTVRGTGGALTGSMLTTVGGVGVLVLAILGVLGQFGLLIATSIVYSYLTSLLILPSALVLWDRWRGHDPTRPAGAGEPPGEPPHALSPRRPSGEL